MAVSYTLTRSRRKTVAKHIKPDGSVEVRAPIRFAESEIERFIAAKADWIGKKQAHITARTIAEPRELPPTPYAKGEFEKTASELVMSWEKRLGVKAVYVGIRAMTSRWGSCTARTRRIRLNSALVNCPFECLEYVIVHELAHLRENNHSSRFWAIVASVLPDYKERQKKLKSLSWLLAC